jgi:hypothetical protein
MSAFPSRAEMQRSIGDYFDEICLGITCSHLALRKQFRATEALTN